MDRERDSRGRFVSRGRSSIPTSSLTPTRPCSDTPSSKICIPSFIGTHRIPEVYRYEIQQRDSPTSSIEVIVEEPTSLREEVIFVSSIVFFSIHQKFQEVERLEPVLYLKIIFKSIEESLVRP